MNNLSTKTVFPFNITPQKKKRVVETFKRSVETLKTRLPAYPLTLLPAPWKHSFKLVKTLLICIFGRTHLLRERTLASDTQ